jgi:hypothetical protein
MPSEAALPTPFGFCVFLKNWREHERLTFNWRGGGGSAEGQLRGRGRR